MAGTPIEILIKALGAEEVVAALKKVTAEGATVKKSLEDTGRSLDTLGTKAKGPLGNISTELTKTTTSTNQFKGVLTSVNPTLNDFGKSFNNAAAGAPKLTTALDQTAQKGQTLSGIGRNLSSSFQGVMTSTVALTGSAIALFETWDSVSDSELNVAKARNTLEAATIKLHSLEAQRNKLIAEGKTNTDQYAIVEEKLALQHQKVEAATGTLANAEENLAIIQTHFYKEIIPLTLSAGASMFDLFAKGKEGIKAMGETFKGLIPAIKNAAASFSLISLTNPFFLALTIGGGIIAAFVTNLGGFRDAVNGVGVAIGNAVPFLRPFLEMLGAAGKFLTDTFGGGAQQAQAFEGEFSGSMDAATASALGFQDGATSAIDGVAGATVRLSTATGEAVNISGQYLDSLIKRYQATKTQLENTFSRTVQLGPNASVAGISGVSNLGTKPEPLSEFFRSEYGKQGQGGGANPFRQKVDSVKGLEDAMRSLTDVTVFYDETEKKLYIDQNQLNTAYNSGKINADQYQQIVNLLSGSFDGALVSGNANVGMYDQLGETLDVLTGKSKPVVDMTAAQAIAAAQNTSAMSKLNEEFNKNWAILNSSTAAQDLYNQGQKKLQNDLMAANIELRVSTGYWDSYNQALQDTQVQQSEFNQGVVAQKQAFVESKVNVLQTAGAYSELLKQMQTGEPQTIAYTQAVLDQKIALEQSKIEVYALQGTLDTLLQQYQSGEQSVVAFNKGFIEQKTSLIQTAIEIDSTRGAYEALFEELVSGNAQVISWNKGLVEGRLAILQSIQAVEEAAGAQQAYNESITSGAAETVAYQQAVIDTRQAVAEGFVALESSRGALEAYTELMNKGIPAYNAYHQAILDVQMANAKLDETIMGSLGTYQEQLKALNDTTIQSQKAGLAFLEGKDSALKWAESMQAMEFSNAGLMRGLAEIDHSFGMVLPESIRLTEEGAKNLIVAFGNVGAASAQMASESYKAGLELTSGVADAIKEGGKDVDESLEEIENKLGREFPDSVKEAIVSANIGKTISETFVDGLDVAQTAIANGAKALDIQKLVNGFAEDFKAGFEKMTPAVQKQAAGIMAKINYELSQGPKDATGGVEGWLNRIKSLVETVPGVVDPAASSIKDMANIDFSASIEQLNSYKSSLDSVTASLKTYNENTGGLFQNATPTNVFTSESAKQNTKGSVGGPPTAAQQGPDTSAIDAAQVKLETFKTALQALPAFITEQVTAANASFLPLGDPFLNEIPTKILNFSTTLSTMPQFIMESVVVPVNTSLITLGDPFLNEIPQKVLQFSQTISQLPGFIASNVVSPIIQNFTGMANALQAGPFTKIQRDAAVAFQAVTNIARAEAAKLSTIFDAAIQNAISKFQQLQNTAASVMNSISSSANNARSSVNSLADSINSLRDRTVTITTRYETIGSPSGAATGFGPTIVDHPTRLLVGESGPEYVQVTPLSSSSGKNLGPEKRLDMFADPGKKRQNTAPLFELATGTTTSWTDPNGNNWNIQNDPSNIANSNPVVSNGGNWVDVNIAAVGGRNVSTFGGAVPIYGGTGGSVGGGGGSSGGGGGSSGGGSSGGAPGNQNFNYQDGAKFYRYQNGQIDTNMTESEIAAAEAKLGYKFPRNASSPSVPNTGGGGSLPGGSSGGGAGTSYTVPSGVRDREQAAANGGATHPNWQGTPNMDPDSWRAVPMENDPGVANFNGWKVVDNQGKNIAVRFNTKAEAEEYIRQHRLAKQRGSYNNDPLGGGQSMDIPAGGGGSSSGGGQFNFGGEPMEGEYRGPTGYIVPNYVKTTGGSKWQNPNMNPETWHSEPMTSKGYEGKWKVVDDNGVIIAAEFHSQTGADEFISDHIAAYNGGTNPALTNNPTNNNPMDNGGQTVTGSGPASSVGGVQQSHIVNQGSTVNQGNNSNIDLMSGTNSRLRIQNGVVVEATGIYAGYNGSGPLPGGGAGSALTGSILEPLRGKYRSGQDNQYAIFDNGAAAGMYDVGITPCMLDAGAGRPPGGPGSGIGDLTDVLQMMLNLLRNFNMPFNINTYLDGDTVYKNQVRKYMGNLATFMN